MASFDLLSTVDLKSSYQKAVKWLAAKSYDCFFLPLPNIIERYIQAVSRGRHYRDLLLKMNAQNILREPYDTQLIRAMQPLFEYLSQSRRGRDLEVCCYKADFDWSFAHDFANQILLLTLRGKLHGIRTEDWIKLLMEEIIFAEEVVARDAYLLSKKARARNVCLAGSSCDDLKLALERSGNEVKLIELDVSVKPLDLLGGEIKRKMRSGEEVSQELAKKLIELHLKFTNIILEKGYEDAYQLWCKMLDNELG